MKIDWQAYLDGSLSDSDRAIAQNELRTNPRAVQELDGLKGFIEAVKQSALQEAIPYERLAKLIPAEKSAKPSNWLPSLGWTAGLAAAATIVFAMLIRDTSVDFDISTSDPVVATRWASDKLGANLPIMDLGPGAKLFYVHEGRDLCCFDYQIGGKTYHVNIGRKLSSRSPMGNPMKLSTGQTAYVSGGVRWSQDGYEMYVSGPDLTVSKDLASRTSSLISRGA